MNILAIVFFCTATLPGTSSSLKWQIKPGSLTVTPTVKTQCSTAQFPGAVNKLVITEEEVFILPLQVEPPK